MTTFGSKEPWMEPMNVFLTAHRQAFKSFIDSICTISSDRATSSIPPSYATPITVLSRLPTTSREGFPSLPYLIDQAREFATLIGIWGNGVSARPISATASDEIKIFHQACDELRLRTRDCLNHAEQAERPSGTLEVKWRELIEQMDHRSRNTSLSNEPRPTSATASSPRSSIKQGRRRLTESSTNTTASISTNHSEHISPETATPETASTRPPNPHQNSRPAIRHTTNGRSYPTAVTSTARSSSEWEQETDLTPPGSSSGVWDPGTDADSTSSARFPSHALHWNENEEESEEEGIESLEGSVKSLEVETHEDEKGVWNGIGIAPRSPIIPGRSGKKLVDVWGFRKRGGGSGGLPKRGGSQA